MQISKNFYLEDFVSQIVYNTFGANAINFIDPKIIVFLERLIIDPTLSANCKARIAEGNPPIVLNTWRFTQDQINNMNSKAGSNYDFNSPIQNRGFRDATYIADNPYWQHHFGRAIIFDVLGLQAEGIANYIITNFLSSFRSFGITAISNPVIGLKSVYADFRCVSYNVPPNNLIIIPEVGVVEFVSQQGNVTINIYDGVCNVTIDLNQILTSVTGSITTTSRPGQTIGLTNPQNITQLDIINIGCIKLKGLNALVTLQTLNIQQNSLAFLDVKNNFALQTLTVNNNLIEKIDLTNNIMLVNLNLSNNNLILLDVSKNKNLKNLNVNQNGLGPMQVDAIFIALAANNVTDCTITTQQVVPAPPTNNSQAARTQLLAAGCTITTD